MRARLTFCFLLLVALAFPALSQDRRGGPSLDRVLPQIARAVPGTFYDAEGPFLTADGRASYRIKWMTPEGRIIWFNVDARTGQVLGGAPMQHTNQYRNDDDRDRGSRGQHWGDDRDRDDRGNGHDWNQGARNDRSGDRGGDRGRDWNQGGRGSDRSGNRSGGRDWKQNGRGGDNNRGGDHGNNRGGHDRRHGG